MTEAMNKLQDDGVAAFAKSFVDLLQTLEDKREVIVSRQVSPYDSGYRGLSSRGGYSPQSLECL